MKLILSFLLILFSLFGFSQAGDCPGFCLQTSGVYTAASGAINELNVTNRGCLIANEANSSYWFQICFSSAGQFQFYIDPSGNRNDFDWAVWNTTTCPPTTAPIRCSYAAVPNGGPCATCDWTGLGTNPNTGILATDVSETATGDGWVAPITVTSGQCLTININNFKNGSNTFTINLTGTTANITTSPGCSPLPIELILFGVEDKEIYNLLSWSTATEINNHYFSIERSNDGMLWEEIAQVQGNGNSSTKIDYSYSDYTRTLSVNYYRLKQTDYDGSYEYAEIIYIDNSIKESIKVIKAYNLMGIEVDINSKGALIYQYSDGKHKKVFVR